MLHGCRTSLGQEALENDTQKARLLRGRDTERDLQRPAKARVKITCHSRMISGTIYRIKIHILVPEHDGSVQS
jgi:hypothetical protein